MQSYNFQETLVMLVMQSSKWAFLFSISLLGIFGLTLITQQRRHWLPAANCYVMGFGRGLGERKSRREGGRERERGRDFAPLALVIPVSASACMSVTLLLCLLVSNWKKNPPWCAASASHPAPPAAPWREDAGTVYWRFTCSHVAFTSLLQIPWRVSADLIFSPEDICLFPFGCIFCMRSSDRAVEAILVSVALWRANFTLYRSKRLAQTGIASHSGLYS